MPEIIAGYVFDPAEKNVDSVKLNAIAGAATINNDAVTRSKIAANAVNDSRLASHAENDSERAVGTNHVKGGAVTRSKIAAGAVNAGQLASHASDNSERAVTTDHLRTGAVTPGKLAQGVFDLMHPVGSIYISTSATNPGSGGGVFAAFSSTWSAFAAGRFLAGVGTSENTRDLDEEGEGDTVIAAAQTGGKSRVRLAESELPAHTHDLKMGQSSAASSGGCGGTPQSTVTDECPSQTENEFARARGDDHAHENLPPYVGVYMWRRDT